MEKGSSEGFADGIYALPEAPIQSSSNRTEVPLMKQPATSQSAPMNRISFKDTVEYFASKNNILFMPTGKIHSSGKQVFLFGNVHVYLNGNVVFYEQALDAYAPISLDTLLQIQSRRSTL
jgi:hypothetical protein